MKVKFNPGNRAAAIGHYAKELDAGFVSATEIGGYAAVIIDHGDVDTVPSVAYVLAKGKMDAHPYWYPLLEDESGPDFNGERWMTIDVSV